jgi:hypothetical protein
MLGPISTKPISSLRISPIGIVQKFDNSWRLISHLSFPSGSSVNDFIHEDFRRVKCSSFDKVVEMISSLGRSARNAKNVGHTVLFSAMGTPNLLLIFMKVSMSILQLLLDSDPAKIKF